MAGKRVEIVVHHRNLDAALRFLDSLDIPEQSKKDIVAFKDWGIRQGLSQARVLKYVQILTKLSQILKVDYRAGSREDFERVMDWITQHGLSDWSQQSYKVVLKKFVWWVKNKEIQEKNNEIRTFNSKHSGKQKPLIEELDEREYPTEVKWIKTTMKKNNGYKGIELPKRLLEEDEILRMIDKAKSPRDKAIIAVLYETGLRASELLTMRIEAVEVGRTSHLIVEGKTGQRQVLVYWSVPYIREWLNAHPAKNDSDAPLWAGLQNSNYMRYQYLCKMLRKTAEKAKVDKSVHPHLFRHSSATRNARIMTYAQLCDYYGWSMSSQMPKIYLHRAGLNTDEAILRAYGETESKEEFEASQLKPKKCVSCGTENQAGFKYCAQCGTPLSVQAVIDRDSKIREINKISLKENLGQMSKEEAKELLLDVLLK